jgi:Flp pilus assembly pilin Flp
MALQSRSPAAAGINKRKRLEEIKMRNMIQTFRQLRNDEAGQGLIEYVMLAALVIAAAAACFPGLANALTTAFAAIGTTLLKYIT